MSSPNQQPPIPSWASQAPPPPPKKKTSAGKIVGLGCLGMIGLFIVIGFVGAAVSGKTTATGTQAPAPAATTGAGQAPQQKASQAPAPVPPSSQAPAAPAGPTTLLDIHGTGIKNTPEFTTGSSWTLHYTYDCSKFGNQGNFIVSDETGMPLANELGDKGSADSPQYSGGKHHLAVNSECSWTLKVTG